MNIAEIFIKGRKVSIKKRNSDCVEIHSWIIIEKDDFIHLRRLGNEKLLYKIENSDEIEMEIISPSGLFGFNSKIKESISENEIIAEIPVKIFQMRKRAFKRAEVKFAAEINYKKDRYKSIVMDISEGGVYIASNSEIKVGELIEIETVIESNERIKVEGNIKRREKFMHGNIVKKYGYGVEFTEINKDICTIIRNYIYGKLKR